MQFELLAKHHDKMAFNCGNDAINRYLWNMANQHAKKDIARTHILANNSTILGFYTLVSMSINNNPMLIKGYPERIPVILIGRMGVDLSHQGKQLSKKILLNALHNIKKVSLITGVAFAMIEAKNEKLAHYYESLGFNRISNDSLTLLYPVKHIEIIE